MLKRPALLTLSLCLAIGQASCADDKPLDVSVATPRAEATALPLALSPIDAASPFMGSGGFGYSFGSAFPGAAAPNGMVKVGPDTTGDWGTINFLHYCGYWYGDSSILGFSHMHLHGTGATDYGILLAMPVTSFDATLIAPSGYASTFAKSSETASPGYYAVTLDNGSIRAEMTSTVHAAYHRYTYPADTSNGTVVFDLSHHLAAGTIPQATASLDAATGTVTGMLHSVGGMSGGFGGYDVYFELQAKTPWTSAQVWSSGNAPAPGDSVSGSDGGDSANPKPLGFALTFADVGATPVEFALGLSLVSAAGAHQNLATEVPAFSFESTRQTTAAAWTDKLSRIKVQGGTAAQQQAFYSSLYHNFLMPSALGDVDGSYVGNDKQIHVATGFTYLQDMSLWDTYRTVNPLYALITPDLELSWMQSLLAMAEASGSFPKWPLADGEAGTMIGASAEVVLADGYIKGLTDFDAAGAYAILRAAAMDPVAPAGGRGGRNGVEDYMSLGYYPSTPAGNASVSINIEFARDDFSLSNFARALGQSADADALLARSANYKNLYDPVSGLFRGKNPDGSWTSPESPTTFGTDYDEADGIQTLFTPAFDPQGLAALVGGQAAFVQQLEQYFEQAETYYENLDPTDVVMAALQSPYYWPGNEPSMHDAYLFAQVGRPDLTQKWLSWSLATRYSAQPDGLPGNDDGGTLSGYYIFSSMGFYPLAGSDQYIVGAPLFSHIDLALSGGVFTIDAPDVDASNIYVQSVTLNGAPLTSPVFHHADLKAGGSLVFTMGPSPSNWGQGS